MISNRYIAFAANIATFFLIAGLTHLVAVLILPDVASKDAFDRLKTRGTENRMTMLPPSRPGESLIPFRDPATIQGFCFYDLAKSPVRVRTTVEQGRLLTLSFRTPRGKIFYSMTDRAALRNVIDIRLVTAAQLQAVEGQDDEDAGLPSELRLRAPSTRGLVVATALVLRPGDIEDAETRIKSISCAPEPLPAVAQ